MSSANRPRHRAGRSAPDRALVDSGAWLGFFSASDDRHAAADALFRQAAATKVSLLTTSLVVAEVHRLLLFHAGSRAAATALSRIDESRLVRVIFPSESHHRSARAWLAKLADQKITYTDATSFAVMDAERCHRAISFDRDFWLAGFEIWQA